MAGFSQFGQAFQGANATDMGLQQVQQQRQQAAAKVMLAKALQQYAAQQSQGQGQPQLSGAPTGPVAAPAAGGVSPQVAGPAMPASGAPGGAGPQAAAAPSGGGAPASVMGMDSQIIKLLAAQGGNPNAQGYAMENLANMSKPVMNNAARIEVQQMRDLTNAPKIQADIDRAKKARDWRDPSQRTQPRANKTATSDNATGMKTSDLLRQEGQLQRLIDSDSATDEEKASYRQDLQAVIAELNKRRKAAGLPPKAVPASGTDSTPAYSQEDLEYTAKQNNMTVDEVKKKLGIQ